MKGFIRVIIGTLVTGLVGCLLIAFAAPVFKIFVAQHQLNEAKKAIRQNQHEVALKRLARFQPWSDSYVNTAAPAACEAIRCRVRLNDIAGAEKDANAIFDGEIGRAKTPGFSPTPGGVMTFLREGPDWIANKLIGSNNKGKGFTPASGWEALLLELEATDNLKMLDPMARKFAARDPSNEYASGMVAFLDQLKENPKKAAEARQKRAAARAKARSAASTPSPAAPIEPAPEQEGPVEATEPDAAAAQPDQDIEKKRSELQARQNELKSAITARQARLQTLYPPTPAETAYVSAQKTYKEAIRKTEALEKQVNSATGPRRQQLLDQARVLKGEVSRVEIAMKHAETTGKAAETTRKRSMVNDTELLNLQDQLRRVENELKSL